MKIHRITKDEIAKVERYLDASCSDIFDAYGKVGKGKRDAYKTCKEKQEMYDGYDFRITGNNRYTFSCAFKYKIDGVEYLYYMTKGGDYDISLDEYRKVKGA